MANQWGRGGTPASQPSNMRAVIFAIVFSLVLGAAGGYVYMRFAVQTGADDVSALTTERDQLAEQVKRQSQELDEMTLKLMSADGDKGDDTKNIEAERQKLGLQVATAEEERDRALSDKAGLEQQLKALEELTKLTTANNQAADAPNSKQQRQLDEARKARDKALADMAALQQQLTSLQELTKLTTNTNQTAARDNKALLDRVETAEKALDQAAGDRSILEAQVADLRQQLSKVQAGASDQDRAKLTNQVAVAERARDQAIGDRAILEEQVTDLRQQLARAGEGDKDRAKLVEQTVAAEKARDQAVAEKIALEGQIDDLLKQVTEAANGGKDADASRRQLQAQLAAAETARDRVGAEKAILEEQIAELRKGSSDSQSKLADELQALKQTTIPELQALVDQRQAEIIKLDDERAKAVASAETLTKHAGEANRTIANLREEQAKGFDERLKLEGELSDLRQKLATAASDVQPQTPATNDATVSGLPTVPRDAFEVEDVMNRTPGLDKLGAKERETLKQKLVSGECVTTSLEAVFTRVPVISLRNLIRDLNSNC